MDCLCWPIWPLPGRFCESTWRTDFWSKTPTLAWVKFWPCWLSLTVCRTERLKYFSSTTNFVKIAHSKNTFSTNSMAVTRCIEANHLHHHHHHHHRYHHHDLIPLVCKIFNYCQVSTLSNHVFVVIDRLIIIIIKWVISIYCKNFTFITKNNSHFSVASYPEVHCFDRFWSGHNMYTHKNRFDCDK